MHTHIASYTHQNRIAVIVEITTKDDFATMTCEFKEFCSGLMHRIAATNPADMKELMSQPYVKDGNKAISTVI